MAYNARKIISEHGAHRSALSTPGSARRVLSLSHTPGKEHVEEEERHGKKRLSARRTLSQPLVLSSDSSDGEPVRAKPPTGRSSAPAGKTSGTSVQPRRTIDRNKYRKALQDEDDEAGGGNEFDAALRKKQAAKQSWGAEGGPPAGPENTSSDVPASVTRKEHRDVLRSRGTSLPVARAPSALCYDVGGFLTFGPTALTSTTNLREFRGKVVLIGQQDLVHAGRFSSAGSSALIVAAKNPEHARVEYSCSKDTRIPVVFLSEVGALGLEHGSLVKMMFDVASESPVSERPKLSKNAHYRRVVSGSQEKVSPDSKVDSLHSHAVNEVSADSGTDSDKDAEFYLVRRRRKSATQSSRNQTPRGDPAPARSLPGSATYKAVNEIASDANDILTLDLNKQSSDAGAKNSLRLELVRKTPRKDQPPRSTATNSMVDDMMKGTSTEILRKIEVFSDSNTKGVRTEQFVAALAARLNEQLVCATEPRKRLDAIFRVRELCRAKPATVAPQVVSALIHLSGALDTFWVILAGPTSVQDDDSAASWLSAQVQNLILYLSALNLRGDDDLLLSVTADGRRRMPAPRGPGPEECRTLASIATSRHCARRSEHVTEKSAHLAILIICSLLTVRSHDMSFCLIRRHGRRSE